MFESPVQAERWERHEARIRGAGTKPATSAFAISFEAFTKRLKAPQPETVAPQSSNNKRKASSLDHEVTTASRPQQPELQDDRQAKKRRSCSRGSEQPAESPQPGFKAPKIRLKTRSAKEAKTESSAVVSSQVPWPAGSLDDVDTEIELLRNRSRKKQTQPKLKEERSNPINATAGSVPAAVEKKLKIDAVKPVREQDKQSSVASKRTKIKSTKATLPNPIVQEPPVARTAVADQQLPDDIVSPDLAKKVAKSIQKRTTQKKPAPKQQRKKAAEESAGLAGPSLHNSPAGGAEKPTTTNKTVKKSSNPEPALSERSVNLPSPKKTTACAKDGPKPEDDLDWLFDSHESAQTKAPMTKPSTIKPPLKKRTTEQKSRTHSKVEEMDLDDLVSNIALFAPSRLKR